MLCISIILYLTWRKILYVSIRGGRNEMPFRCYKFITMNPTYDTSTPEKDRLNGFTRMLRLSSLDELPQLWNVIRGDMSLVGPRPLPIEYTYKYSLEQRKRFFVKPGITGWAQVNGRNTISWEEKFKLDIEYVNQLSCLIDLKILYKTLWTVFDSSKVNANKDISMKPF